MKKLQTTDIFAACRLVKAIGVKKEIQKVAEESDSIKDAWDRGFDLLWAIFDKATEKAGETAIYEFLAGPFETDAESVASMELPELFNSLKQLAKENDLINFFKSVQRLTK